MVSKTELKKRQKLRANEEKKKKKDEEKAKKKAEEAKKGAQGESNANANIEEEEKDPTKYTENRKNFVQAIRDSGANPYPHKFTRTHRIDEYRAQYDDLLTEKDVFAEDQTVALTGRILIIRAAGKNILFIDIEGDGAKVQVLAQSNHYLGDFSQLHSTLRRGDIIGVEGCPGRSRSGELSVRPTKITSLSYCLHMLPKRDGDK